MFKRLVIILMLSHHMIGMNNNNEEKCTICLDPIKLFMKFSCNHAMHIECYNEYRTHIGDVCPTCPKTMVKNNNQSFFQKIVSRATGTQENQKRLTLNNENLKRELKAQTDLNEERRLTIVRLEQRIIEQKLRGQKTLADLEDRYNHLKQKIKTVQSANEYDKYGYWGAGITVSSLIVQQMLGFAQFEHKSWLGMMADLLIGALCGYVSAVGAYKIGALKSLEPKNNQEVIVYSLKSSLIGFSAVKLASFLSVISFSSSYSCNIPLFFTPMAANVLYITFK